MKKNIYFYIFLAFLFLESNLTFALKLDNPLGSQGVTTIPGLVDKIIDFLIQLSAPVVTIMILVGAFKMLTAGGNTDKFKEGKKTITYAVIGLAIILISKGITSIVKDFLGIKN
jgi:hypothetical protein